MITIGYTLVIQHGSRSICTTTLPSQGYNRGEHALACYQGGEVRCIVSHQQHSCWWLTMLLVYCTRPALVQYTIDFHYRTVVFPTTTVTVLSQSTYPGVGVSRHRELHDLRSCNSRCHVASVHRTDATLLVQLHNRCTGTPVPVQVLNSKPLISITVRWGIPVLLLQY